MYPSLSEVSLKSCRKWRQTQTMIHIQSDFLRHVAHVTSIMTGAWSTKAAEAEAALLEPLLINAHTALEISNLPVKISRHLQRR
jgi:hypothetical protein